MIKLIKESYGDLSDYLERHLDSWYGRLNELQDDIENLGLDVDEINNEYVIVHAAEPDGEDVYCKIRLGGTPRTISLETFEMLESVRKPKKAISEFYRYSYDNQRISDILDKIEQTNDQRKIDKAYDFINRACDNIDDCMETGFYDLSDALWGYGTDYIIEELTDILNESLRQQKRKERIDEVRKPKYWNSIFATKVIDAYKSGKLTLTNISDWETDYNDGVKPNRSLGTEEILRYYISTGNDPRKNENVLKESDDKITARSFQELISKLEDHGYSCGHYYDMKYPESNWLYITKNGDPYEAEFYRYSDGEYELYLHNIHPTKRRNESVSEEKDTIRIRFLEHTSYDYPDRRRLAESITNLVFRTNDKKTHMNRLLKTDLKFASKMYRDRILKCNTAEELSETLSRCSVDALKRTKASLEESKKRCHRNKLTEKSNFDDTQKAIDYYYPKWYYDDMSINDIYDRLEKLGHSQDFIDAVIDGITDRYENEEDRGLDDYDECLD